MGIHACQPRLINNTPDDWRRVFSKNHMHGPSRVVRPVENFSGADRFGRVAIKVFQHGEPIKRPTQIRSNNTNADGGNFDPISLALFYNAPYPFRNRRWVCPIQSRYLNSYLCGGITQCAPERCQWYGILLFESQIGFNDRSGDRHRFSMEPHRFGKLCLARATGHQNQGDKYKRPNGA